MSECNKKQGVVHSIEAYCDRVEPMFWSMRYVAVVSVFASFCVALLWFGAIFVDVLHILSAGVDYFSGVLTHKANALDLRNRLVFFSVETIDGVLMASIFLVFSYGLYEFFISKISVSIEDAKRIRSKILMIKDIDELKGKLAKLILMVLIVKLFYSVLTVKLDLSAVGALDDLLKLGGVLVLIALSVFLSHSGVHITMNRSEGDEEMPSKSSAWLSDRV